MLIIDSEINQALQAAYAGARKQIYIITYTIAMPKRGCSVLYRDTFRQLEMAILRGVNVCIILERWDPPNPQSVSQMAAYDYLTKIGAFVCYAKKSAIMHAKTWQFDDNLLIIGSHNSTEAGFTKTKNLSVLVEDQLINNQYRQYFLDQWRQIHALKLN